MAEALGQEVRGVVSSDSEELILVDEHDTEIGVLSKAGCHDGDGMLHRAFSIFIFNRDGELLLQRRSGEKRLWPMYWSNSCCSHPRRGETMDEATHRRLYQELRMTGELHYLFKFQYQARFGDLGAENELCWVYVGHSDDDVLANPHEVADWRWVKPERLDDELERRPQDFTPWFKLEWPRVKEGFRDQLGL